MTRAQKAVEKAGQRRLTYTRRKLQLLGIATAGKPGLLFPAVDTEKCRYYCRYLCEDLSERKKVVKSGVDHGIVLPDNLLALEAAGNIASTKLTGIESYQQSKLLKRFLCLWIQRLSNQVVPAIPCDMQVSGDPSGRPEFQMFEKQKERLLANQKLVSSSDLPKFYAFSQAAYGRPGYNLASRSFHTFYTVGVGYEMEFPELWGQQTTEERYLEITERNSGGC